MNRTDLLTWLSITIDELHNTPRGNDPRILTEDMVLEDLGLDSLDIVELQMAYEDAFNCSTPDATTAPRTIGDLLALLAE